MAGRKLIYWLNLADRQIQNMIKQHLPPEILSGSQMVVLFHLYQHDGMSLRELAQNMQLVPSAITGLVQRMEQQGLLHRRTSEADNRVHCLFLTALSKQLLPQILKKTQELNQFMQHGFSEHDMQIVEKWLRYVARDLRQRVENA